MLKNLSRPVKNMPRFPGAIILDFDGTVIRGNVVDPILKEAGLDAPEFWKKVRSDTRHDVPGEVQYLDCLADELSKGGPDFNRESMKEVAANLEFWPGMPEITGRLRTFARPAGLDLYVIGLSSAPALMIKHSVLGPNLDAIIGAELDHQRGTWIPGRGVSSLDKAEFLRRINIGTAFPELPAIPMQNVIYVGDGPTDLDAFATVRSGGGKNIIVYAPKNEPAWRQASALAYNYQAVDFVAPADYTKNSQLEFILNDAIGDAGNKSWIAYQDSRNWCDWHQWWMRSTDEN